MPSEHLPGRYNYQQILFCDYPCIFCGDLNVYIFHLVLFSVRINFSACHFKVSHLVLFHSFNITIMRKILVVLLKSSLSSTNRFCHEQKKGSIPAIASKTYSSSGALDSHLLLTIIYLVHWLGTNSSCCRISPPSI